MQSLKQRVPAPRPTDQGVSSEVPPTGIARIYLPTRRRFHTLSVKDHGRILMMRVWEQTASRQSWGGWGDGTTPASPTSPNYSVSAYHDVPKLPMTL